MMFEMIRIVIVATICIVVIQAAPKSRNSEPYYDQKQTGSYNVRLKLKGVQLITMFDDVGNFGDYDYNYDYADLTMKPVLPMFTVSPNSNSSTTTIKPDATTAKLTSVNGTSSTPKPELNATETKTPKPESDNIVVIKPVVLNGNITSIKNITSTTVFNDNKVTENPNVVTNSSSVKSNGTLTIVEVPSDVNTTNDTPNVIMIPEHFSLLSSLMGFDKFANLPTNNQQFQGHQPRRCASGFKRDKYGRCRRLRRRNNGSNYHSSNPSKVNKNWW